MACSSISAPLRLAETFRKVSRHRLAIDLADPRVRQLKRHLESGLQNLALLRGIGSGHPDAPLALGVETLAYRSSARMIAIALG